MRGKFCAIRSQITVKPITSPSNHSHENKNITFPKGNRVNTKYDSSAQLGPSIPVGDFQLGRRLHKSKQCPGPGEGGVLSLLQLLHLLRDLALLVRCKKIERGGENEHTIRQLDTVITHQSHFKSEYSVRQYFGLKV